MERCTTSKLQYQRNNKKNHEVANTHLPANNQYFCEKRKGIINIADERSHLKSNQHKVMKNVVF